MEKPIWNNMKNPITPVYCISLPQVTRKCTKCIFKNESACSLSKIWYTCQKGTHDPGDPQGDGHWPCDLGLEPLQEVHPPQYTSNHGNLILWQSILYISSPVEKLSTFDNYRSLTDLIYAYFKRNQAVNNIMQ